MLRPGIEPGSKRWQRSILPLNYRSLLTILNPQLFNIHFKTFVNPNPSPSEYKYKSHKQSYSSIIDHDSLRILMCMQGSSKYFKFFYL